MIEDDEDRSPEDEIDREHDGIECDCYAGHIFMIAPNTICGHGYFSVEKFLDPASSAYADSGAHKTSFCARAWIRTKDRRGISSVL
ncbi:MAG: hypothetical protein UY47_C0004G0028 [Parcubacteria group bacterium GW2011_GWB1_49_7]|nr:MAG: hypothetical protein UX71_C0002G0084 [Parcubacteria group bacterium GW2011_GWA1_47_10]KKW09854.1 MAG: hypothetical protein UY47_C0004G0028 [Parcubacteria group bacterium GW2011_GWB1_49_7]